MTAPLLTDNECKRIAGEAAMSALADSAHHMPDKNAFSLHLIRSAYAAGFAARAALAKVSA